MKNTFLLPYFCLLIIVLSCKSEQKVTTKILQKIEGAELIFTDGSRTGLPSLRDTNITTLFLVRHAEKVDDTDESDLTPAGKKRAEKLAALIKSVPLSYVATTKYKRVLNTIGPAATQQAAPFLTYSPKTIQPFLINLLKREKGKNILVGGHSNTIPKCLNVLTNTQKYEDIPHGEYDHFYVVYLKAIGDAEVMEFRY